MEAGGAAGPGRPGEALHGRSGWVAQGADLAALNNKQPTRRRHDFRALSAAGDNGLAGNP
jgi:hypothetical protein